MNTPIDAGGYKFNVQTLQEPRSGLPFPLSVLSGAQTTSSSPNRGYVESNPVQVICDESVACTGLLSAETLGISPIITSLGLNNAFAYNIAHSSIGTLITETVSRLSPLSANVNMETIIDNILSSINKK